MDNFLNLLRELSMPIYEYQCGQCGHQLESFEKMNDAPLKECPACGKSTLEKLISAAGFQLKGTGWYATDFRNKGKPAEASSSKTSTEKDKGTPAETKSADTKTSTENKSNSTEN